MSTRRTGGSAAAAAAAATAAAVAATANAFPEAQRKRLSIKSVTIQGFKSYRDQTRFEGFSQYQNAVCTLRTG